MSPDLSTILLVEDQPTILRLCQLELEKHGYRVLTAKNAMDAMETCQQYMGSIHLLIADIFLPLTTLPRTTSNQPVILNGIELSQAVRILWPHIQLLFISGYPEEEIQTIGGLPADAAFLAKPFSTEAFLTKVRELVTGKR